MFSTYLLFFTLTFACTRSSNLKTKREMSLEDKSLSTCYSEAVCAHIQVHLKEIHIDELCKCEGGQECPLHWDPNDGHSITQAHDQWKFCSPKSKNTPVCFYEQIAREFLYEMDPVTKNEKMSMHINCVCPENHTHEFFNQRDEMLRDNMRVIQEKCEKMKQCKKTEVCQKIETIQGKLSFKHVKCFCPGEQNCNDDLQKADARDIGNYGYVQHYMECH